MTVRIFRDSGDKVERINRVVKVLNHSYATGNDGTDINVYVLNPDMTTEEKKIHLDKWDFYDVET